MHARKSNLNQLVVEVHLNIANVNYCSITRSPLYAHFNETIGGLVVIRGLRKEDDFQKRVYSRLNAQTRCELAGLAASAWLDLRLQMIALLVVTCVVLTGLVGRALNVVDVSSNYSNLFQ